MRVRIPCLPPRKEKDKMHRYISRFSAERVYADDVTAPIQKNKEDYYSVQEIGKVGGKLSDLPILAVTAIHNNNNPTVFISGGVHGDEPAGTQAAVKFVKEHMRGWINFYNFVVIPCVNPVGYQINIREGSEFQDINREFFHETTSPENKLILKFLAKLDVRSYIMTIDLHETRAQERPASEYPVNERHPDGFHMWEICSEEENRIGNYVIDAVKEIMPVCKWSHIWGDINSGGVIFYPEGAVGEQYQDAHTFENFLRNNYSHHSITTETYSGNCFKLDGDNLENRVQTQLTVINTALKHLPRH